MFHPNWPSRIEVKLQSARKTASNQAVPRVALAKDVLKDLKNSKESTGVNEKMPKLKKNNEPITYYENQDKDG